jgi:hypothetical protein
MPRWLKDGLAIQPQNLPLSVVVPIATIVGMGFVGREVPLATIASQKERTANCGGLSEIRSDVLIRRLLEPSASFASRADPTREGLLAVRYVRITVQQPAALRAIANGD